MDTVLLGLTVVFCLSLLLLVGRVLHLGVLMIKGLNETITQAISLASGEKIQDDSTEEVKFVQLQIRRIQNTEQAQDVLNSLRDYDSALVARIAFAHCAVLYQEITEVNTWARLGPETERAARQAIDEREAKISAILPLAVESILGPVS